MPEPPDRTGAFDPIDALDEGLAEAFAAGAELVALARRCLAAERDDRPRDAAAVARAVTAHLLGVEERARRAELERAAAEARAEQEAHTRRAAQARAAAERQVRRP